MAFDAKVRLTGDTSGIHSAIAAVQKKIAGMSSGMGSAIGGLFAIGTITAGIKNMMSFAGEIQDAADRMGITVERTLQLQQAAKLVGKDLGFVEKNFTKLEAAAMAAVGGNATAMESFNKLGVTAEQVNTLNKGDLLNAVMSGANGMDRTTAEGLLSNIVGKGAAGGVYAMGQNMADAQSGTSDQAEAIGALDDAGDKLDLFITRLKVEAMPVLIEIATAVLEFLTKMRQGFEVVASGVYGLFSKMENFSVGNGLKEIGKGIWNNGKSLVSNTADVVTGKKSVGEGFSDYVAQQQETAGNVLEGFFGKEAVQTAVDAMTEAGQAALDEDAKNAAVLEAKKKERKKKNDSLNAQVNRQAGITDKGDKSPLDNIQGGTKDLAIGGLMGVNSAYRLERLSQETNRFLASIDQSLKDIRKVGSKDISYLREGEG